MRSWMPSKSTLTTTGFFGVTSGVGVGLDFGVGEGDFFSSAFFSSPSFSFCLARFCSALPTSSLRGPSGGSVSFAEDEFENVYVDMQRVYLVTLAKDTEPQLSPRSDEVGKAEEKRSKQQ